MRGFSMRVYGYGTFPPRHSNESWNPVFLLVLDPSLRWDDARTMRVC